MDAGQAWLTVGTVVLSALWTAGGQAALQRRTIQQELELANDLEDPELARGMRRLAEEKATIYIARRHPSDGAARWLVVRVLVISCGATLFATGLGITDQFDHAHPSVWGTVSGFIVWLLGLVLLGGGLGAILDEVFRDYRAWLGSTRYRYARRHIEAASVRSGQPIATEQR